MGSDHLAGTTLRRSTSRRTSPFEIDTCAAGHFREPVTSVNGPLVPAIAKSDGDDDRHRENEWNGEIGHFPVDDPAVDEPGDAEGKRREADEERQRGEGPFRWTLTGVRIGVAPRWRVHADIKPRSSRACQHRRKPAAAT